MDREAVRKKIQDILSDADYESGIGYPEFYKKYGAADEIDAILSLLPEWGRAMVPEEMFIIPPLDHLTSPEIAAHNKCREQTLFNIQKFEDGK